MLIIRKLLPMFMFGHRSAGMCFTQGDPRPPAPARDHRTPTPRAGGSTGQQASCILGPGNGASRPSPHKCLHNLAAKRKRKTAQGTHPRGVAAPVRWPLCSGWETVWPTLTGRRREGTDRSEEGGISG